MIPVSPFMDWVGAQAQWIGNDGVRISLSLAPHHTNPTGVMHGGVVATLLDEAAALAARRRLDEQPGHLSPLLLVEMNVSFIAGARPGDVLEVEGKVLHLGRRVVFAEAEARRGQALVAKGRFTFVRQPSQPEQ